MTLSVTGTPATAFASVRAREFTDSLGRTVMIPFSAPNVTPTGVCAQAIVTQIDAGKLASGAVSPAPEDDIAYEQAGKTKALDVTETGTIEGSTTHGISAQEVADLASPSLVIDAGFCSTDLKEKIDALQAESDIPHVFIDASFGKLPQAYRTIGSILGREERAEELALLVEEIYLETTQIANASLTQLPPLKVFYAPYSKRISLDGGVNVQLDALRHLGVSVIEAPYDFANKSINLEVLANSEVDLILFDDATICESLIAGAGEGYETWNTAIQNTGCSYVSPPALFHNWFGNMVLVQSIGLLWLSSVLYPESCTWSIDKRSDEIFDVLYGLPQDDQLASGLVSTPSEIEQVTEE